jgi:acyl dehydratase
LPETMTFEQFRAQEGQVLGQSAWVQIVQEDLDRFAELNRDPSWIHNDPARAAEGPFGAPVVQGMLTLALVPGFVWDTVEISDSEMNVIYGFERCRFPQPVLVDSRIRGACTLQSVREVAEGIHRSTIEVAVEIEEQQRPACVAALVVQHVLA